MPKKPPRNAFYFYMIDFKEEQRKKGIHYANMKEVADAAGPAWQQIPPPVRSKYESKAKAEKQKFNGSNQKFTSTGVSFAEIDQLEKELKEAECNEREDIKSLVRFGNYNKMALDLDIYLMDVNFYCKYNTEYLIGESTVLRFNLRDGIQDYYHELIHPGQIPKGYAFDVKLGCQEYGLDMPDETKKRSNYMQILANIIDYLKKQDRKVSTLPPIFTMPDKVLPVQNFIMQLCRNAGEDDALFRVYKLDFLFYTLINAVRSNENEGFPKESLSLVQLKKDVFQYTPGLGCQHHEEIDKAVMCTTSRTKRWAYTVLDSCCPLIDVQVQPGKHIPPDFDLESIILFKEQKKVSSAPYLQIVQGGPPSSRDSQVSSSSEATAGGASEGPKKEKRVHVPLRMPRTDFSLTIGQVPEMTDNEGFVTVTGRGRGAGLAGSLKNLQIKK